MELTHFDSEGNAHMVDVGAKRDTARLAVAEGIIWMAAQTRDRIEAGQIQKGDVLSVARLAGIMGAKKTSDLIPLCHPLRIDSVDINFEFRAANELVVRATVRATDRTGVEMEALTAVAVAALTVYDMCKSVDREMEIRSVCLLKKEGGKSGSWKRPGASGS